MNKTIEHSVKADEMSVSRLAYQLWENAGRPASRDMEFWLAAEAKVHTAARQPAPSAPPVMTPSSPVQARSLKVARPTASGIKKTWPKPYPNLPKF